MLESSAARSGDERRWTKRAHPSANGVADQAASAVRRYTAEELKEAVLAKLTYSVGKNTVAASQRDWFLAVAFATRDIVVDRWIESTNATYADDRKRVYYLSLEFLIGRMLFDAMTNLGIVEPMSAALSQLGLDLAALRRVESDAALGNGGLGRLAACFMDSMATLSIAAHGYGIRYDNGLFRQIIRGGWQQEVPEDWLTHGNPWEFERPECNYAIGFGGWVEAVPNGDEKVHHVWHPDETVEAIGYDTPIVGWRGRHVNTLRLWSARALDPLKLDAFNAGDYVGALTDSVRAEAISKVLYPSDATPAGQELRLRQEYFFASASLLDLVRRHVKQHRDIRTLADHVAVQLNDTHPAIAVAELMRIFVDMNRLEWDEAWKITQAVFSYTNHTLLPEALESWPVPLMERLLPRHMQIIYLINAMHLDSARKRGLGDPNLLASISLIDEHAGRRVRMGNLAFIGSHKINGVSGLHTNLMRETVFHDLDVVYPGRIVNKTNGITFRRWLIECNPRLTQILTSSLGEKALDDADALRGLARFADDSGDAGAVRPRPPRQQGRARAPCRGERSISASTPTRCSTSRSSASTNTSANCSTSSKRSRCTTRSAPSRRRLGAAREDLRRQGGGELRAGQADHQARHRRRARRQLRSRPCAGCSRSCSCPTTMSASPRRSFRRPTCPSRFRPRAWRPPAPAT